MDQHEPPALKPPEAEDARAPEGQHPRSPEADEPGPVPLRRFAGYFLGLGTWGFGGPIATVGYMQRDLVERRRWVARSDFLDGVALGQTMPGPLAAQVVMWVGYLQAGSLGALATVLPFVLPSFVLVLGVAVAYVQFKGLGAIQALFYGIAPAVMAVLALAAIKLARLTNERDARLWAITLVIGVVTAATGTEIALLVVAAGLIMMIWEAPPRRGRRIGATTGSGPAMLAAAPAVSHGLLTGILTAGGLGTLGLFFLKAGAFIFGSGLAIVPFLRSGVVEQHHWLTDAAFLDAVAIGLITPGPVVITATFIGYLVGGFVGAGVATVAIFIPIYIGVVVPGRWFVRHKSHPRVRGFVKGATAAAAGAIAGATVVLSKGAIADWPTVVIALAAVVFLLRFKNREPVLVLLAAAAGLALHPLAG